MGSCRLVVALQSIISIHLHLFLLCNPFKMHLITYLLLLLFMFQNLSYCQAEDPIIESCPSQAANFTSGSKFETNLKRLLSSLTSNGSITGFFNTSFGDNPDTVYGLVQCRGDLTIEDCKSCLNTSSVEIIQKCPNKKEAIIRYEDCLFRYSNASFFSQLNTGNTMLMWNVVNVTDQALFNSQLGDLLNKLATDAASKASKFVTGSSRFKDFGNIYGLVQCTQDLSATDCFSCLQGIINEIPQSSLGGKRGGRVVSISCVLRFEDTPFYRLLPPPSPSPPPPTTPVPTSPSPPGSNDGASNGKSTKGSSSVNVGVIVGPIVAGVALLLLVSVCFLKRKKKNKKAISASMGRDQIQSAESLQFDLVTLINATNNFSDANKLGEGGFGAVYKGELPDGEEIAVKRLSSKSGQGSQEFKNEVVLLHKLQHRNLVRLLGFCLEGEEKILIYEFVHNTSLDKYLFDPLKRPSLDWQRRYKIVGGIARGLLYLHEDSRLRIIHRDLKAGNILLDEEMTAKIADFGMAKLFGVDQTQGNTSRIAGTFGYMAPEYALHGQFSVKSDVFSFGVLLLEIVSGQKVNSFYQSASSQDLLSYAWKQWRQGTSLELMDPTLRDSYARDEVMRCIHIGLLCVQDNIEERPTMSSVVLMLNSYSLTLSTPSQPAFFAISRTRSIKLGKDNQENDQYSGNSSMAYSTNGLSDTTTMPR